MIELENILKTYRTGEVELQALAGVSLRIANGEFVAVMGASGSGKSTLMNILGCLDRATHGRYRLAGHDVGLLDARGLARLRNQQIGFVFQSFNLLSRTTALENVELPLLYARPLRPGAERRARAAHMLELTGLTGRMRHHPNQLSGGQQQRIAIARALVNNPSLLLADEPTGNLDTHTSLEIMTLFEQLNTAGITIVVVTHEPDIAAHCKRVLTMRDGRLIQDSSNPQRCGSPLAEVGR